MTDWRIEAYVGAEGVGRLEAEWRRLVAALPEPGAEHLFEACVAYAAHVSRDPGAFLCLALSDGERVRAICPLEACTVSILGWRRRVWSLPCDLYDLLHDVLCPPDDAERLLLAAVVDHLRARRPRRSWLVLDRIAERSAAWRCLHRLDAQRYCTDLLTHSDEFDCTRPFEELRGRLSRNFRGNLRKAANKLAALPDVRFENVTAPREKEQAFAAFLALEASGWKGAGGTRTAVQSNPRHEGFYRRLLAADACELNVLYAEGRCIAAQFCLRTGAEYAMLKIGYDEAYARVAPGQLLLQWTLERCCEDPAIRRLSLVSGEPWHASWATDPKPVHTAYIGLGGAGVWAVALLRLRFRHGPRVKRWIAPLRRLLAPGLRAPVASPHPG